MTYFLTHQPAAFWSVLPLPHVPPCPHFMTNVPYPSRLCVNITSSPNLPWVSWLWFEPLSRACLPVEDTSCFWLPRLLLWSETHLFYGESAPSSPPLQSHGSAGTCAWCRVLPCLASQSSPGHLCSKTRSESVGHLLQRKIRQTPVEKQNQRWHERIPRISLLSSDPLVPHVGLTSALPSL